MFAEKTAFKPLAVGTCLTAFGAPDSRFWLLNAGYCILKMPDAARHKGGRRIPVGLHSASGTRIQNPRS